MWTSINKTQRVSRNYTHLRDILSWFQISAHGYHGYPLQRTVFAAEILMFFSVQENLQLEINTPIFC